MWWIEPDYKAAMTTCCMGVGLRAARQGWGISDISPESNIIKAIADDLDAPLLVTVPPSVAWGEDDGVAGNGRRVGSVHR